MYREKLRRSILRAQAIGFIGDDIELIERHSERFAEVCQSYWDGPGSGADLGSGGGVPAFVIAELIEDISLLLIETMEKRAAFLREEVAELGLSNRLRVYCGRGEDAGREPEFRERFALVTARGFGPPSPTVEIGSALLALGGGIDHLVDDRGRERRSEHAERDPVAQALPALPHRLSGSRHRPRLHACNLKLLVLDLDQ